MKTKAIVLGCGMVGATMARDLSADAGFEVAAADLSAERLGTLAEAGIRTIRADLGDAGQVGRLVGNFDVVLGALPSRIGFQTLSAVIGAGKPYCDISFMPENALELDEAAKRRGVTCVVDCGVSPGLSNLIVGYVVACFERVDRAVIYVGGLPKKRTWPFEYKAPFAPFDVLEEYTRPARLIEYGQVVTRAALSEPELLEFERVGTLEAFNTDGLRSLLHTVRIPHLVEKTLRYPGHIELMRVLRETGFFGREEIEVGGARVRPIDVTARLMFPLWTFEPGEEEFTVLRVAAEGVKGGVRVQELFELYDETEAESGVTSMARTTAFPCTIVARMQAGGEICERGVLPPERLARIPGVYERIVEQLRSRGVVLTRREELL